MSQVWCGVGSKIGDWVHLANVAWSCGTDLRLNYTCFPGSRLCSASFEEFAGFLPCLFYESGSCPTFLLAVDWWLIHIIYAYAMYTTSSVVFSSHLSFLFLLSRMFLLISLFLLFLLFAWFLLLTLSLLLHRPLFPTTDIPHRVFKY